MATTAQYRRAVVIGKNALAALVLIGLSPWVANAACQTADTATGVRLKPGVSDRAGTAGSNTCADGWTVRAPLPTGASLTGVAWTGSMLVAVGTAGTIITSTDERGANSWSTPTVPTTYDVHDITSTGRDLVAVGERGAILTTPTASRGVAGFRHTPGLVLRRLDGSQLVAVGDHGADVTSPDGIAWNSRLSPHLSAAPGRYLDREQAGRGGWHGIQRCHSHRAPTASPGRYETPSIDLPECGRLDGHTPRGRGWRRDQRGDRYQCRRRDLDTSDAADLG